MARRRASLLEQVAELPWWVGVALAVAVYFFFRFVIPAGTSSSPVLRPLGQAASQLAWLFALLFLAAGFASAVTAFFRGKLFDSRTNLDSIRALSWSRFEQLVGEYFRRDSYEVEETGGGGADGGIDLILRKDGFKAIVQCKRWQTKQVGVRFIRELYGVMTAEAANEAIFVSSGDYTPDARAFADGKPIRLIGGNELLEMIRSVQPAPAVKASMVGDPICPTCARPMVRRTARRGSNAGQEFWGCPAYPQCKGSRSIGVK